MSDVIHIALTGIALLLTALGALVLLFGRSTMADVLRRLVKSEDEQIEMRKRLHDDELETAKQRGEINLLSHRITVLERDEMPRAEIAEQFKSLHRQIEELGERIDRKYPTSERANKPRRAA